MNNEPVILKTSCLTSITLRMSRKTVGGGPSLATAGPQVSTSGLISATTASTTTTGAMFQTHHASSGSATTMNQKAVFKQGWLHGYQAGAQPPLHRSQSDNAQLPPSNHGFSSVSYGGHASQTSLSTLRKENSTTFPRKLQTSASYHLAPQQQNPPAERTGSIGANPKKNQSVEIANGPVI